MTNYNELTQRAGDAIAPAREHGRGLKARRLLLGWTFAEAAAAAGVAKQSIVRYESGERINSVYAALLDRCIDLDAAHKRIQELETELADAYARDVADEDPGAGDGMGRAPLDDAYAAARVRLRHRQHPRRLRGQATTLCHQRD